MRITTNQLKRIIAEELQAVRRSSLSDLRSLIAEETRFILSELSIDSMPSVSDTYVLRDPEKMYEEQELVVTDVGENDVAFTIKTNVLKKIESSKRSGVGSFDQFVNKMRNGDWEYVGKTVLGKSD